MKTHIVIPIGVGAPGTPVQKYLELSVNSILSQTNKDYVLTVAADSNIPDRCKEFLESNNIEIKWFEPYSYFRKGGIWKKIFETWKEKDTELLAFLHYDDYWQESKLEIQTKHIVESNLSGSWSEVFILNGENNVMTGDCSLMELNKQSVGRRTSGFGHSVVISRKELFSSGILEYEDLWAANFEDVWALFIHKIKNLQKSKGAKFFWRNHNLNISNTVNENAEFVKEQRKLTMYSLEDTLKDADSMQIHALYKQTLDLY